MSNALRSIPSAARLVTPESVALGLSYPRDRGPDEHDYCASGCPCRVQAQTEHDYESQRTWAGVLPPATPGGE